jgi:hypothetical protein
VGRLRTFIGSTIGRVGTTMGIRQCLKYPSCNSDILKPESLSFPPTDAHKTPNTVSDAIFEWTKELLA